MSIDADRALAITLQDILNNEPSFEPIEGDLHKYKGVIGTLPNNQPIEIIIDLGRGFPQLPPTVKSLTPITHPIVDNNFTIRPPGLTSWQPNRRVVEIIREIRDHFARVRPQPAKTKVHTRGTLQIPANELEIKIQELQQKLREIEQAIQKERERVLARQQQISVPISIEEEYKAQLDAIEDFLDLLEEYYEDAYISPADYYRLTRVYLKSRYVLSQKIHSKEEEKTNELQRKIHEKRSA